MIYARIESLDENGSRRIESLLVVILEIPGYV